MNCNCDRTGVILVVWMALCFGAFVCHADTGVSADAITEASERERLRLFRGEQLMREMKFSPCAAKYEILQQSLPHELIVSGRRYEVTPSKLWPGVFDWECFGQDGVTVTKSHVGEWGWVETPRKAALMVLGTFVSMSTMSIDSIARNITFVTDDSNVVRISQRDYRVYVILAGKFYFVIQGGPEGRDLAEAIFEYSRQQK